MFSNIIRKIIPKRFIDEIEASVKASFQNGRVSFSHEGEDMLLNSYFEGKPTGFYVDVGAHHPYLFSNTFYFYLSGWRGINIDAKPESMKLFYELRSDDINLEVAISNSSESMIFYDFEESALSGFSADISLRRMNNGQKLVSTIDIKSYRLAEVLERYLPKGQHIDFMSIDVEGLDLEVLQSNNWDLYRPTVVLIEDLYRESIYDVLVGEIYCYMESIEYSMISKCINTTFYVDRKRKI